MRGEELAVNMGTLDKFAGRRSNATRLKHLKINDFIIRSMKFFVSMCIMILVAVLIGAVGYALYFQIALRLEGVWPFASALGLLVVMRIGLEVSLKFVCANKTDLILKMETTPPLTAEERSFDPSKYVESENL
jgi:hypothetical protein